MTTQVLEFAAPCELINANQRLHWATKARRTRDWRWAAQVSGRESLGCHGIGGCPARVIVWFCLPNKRIREVSNLQPTVKAIVDGLVDAGIFTDDNDQIVTGQDARRGEIVKGQTRVRVEIILESVPRD